MKALSVRQPFASLIDQGDKAIEVRSWPTSYRGPLLICSAARKDPDNPDAPLGCALCVVDLVNCREFTVDNEGAANCEYSPGMYAWEFVNVRQCVEPLIPIKGRLGFFDVDIDSLGITLAESPAPLVAS